jgi:hypothetical protein
MPDIRSAQAANEYFLRRGEIAAGSRDRWENYSLESGCLWGWGGVKGGRLKRTDGPMGIATEPLAHAAPLYERSRAICLPADI